MKIKKIIKWALIIAFVCMIVYVIYLFNDIFPKADPIKLPDAKEIADSSLGYNSGIATIKLTDQQIAEMLSYIGKARPTRRQSVNDNPSSRPYYCLVIRTAERQYRYFIYEERDQTYVEMPYDGIYEADAVLLTLAEQYYREGGGTP